MPLATKSFAIEGFQGEFTEYIITLDDLIIDSGTLTAIVILERVGDSAIIDESITTLSISGSVVDGSDADPFSGGQRVELSGSANGGESVVVEFHTDQWGGHTITFSTTAPSPPLTRDDLEIRTFDPFMDDDLLRVSYNIANTSSKIAQFDLILTIDGEERDKNTHTLSPNRQISTEVRTRSNLLPGETQDKQVCISIENLIEG